MTRNRYSIGVVLIIIAVILLLGKLGVFAFLGKMLWPVFVLAPGLLLHFLYFGRMLPSGVLVPGGILVTYSVMFFYCNLFGWHSMSYLWPGFIFGVAVGLYELQLFDRNAPRGTMTAALILGAIAAVLFAISLLFSLSIYVIALLLVAVGIVMVMRRPRSW